MGQKTSTLSTAANNSRPRTFSEDQSSTTTTPDIEPSSHRQRSYSSSVGVGVGSNGIFSAPRNFGGFYTVSSIKCPICSKTVSIPEEIEVHLVMCLTRPRISYNEDRLTESKNEECVICLEDLEKGEIIARLPCLCIYHKDCIDKWFKVNRSCPEHPS